MFVGEKKITFFFIRGEDVNWIMKNWNVSGSRKDLDGRRLMNSIMYSRRIMVAWRCLTNVLDLMPTTVYQFRRNLFSILCLLNWSN